VDLSSGKIRRIEKDKKDFAMVDETGTTPRLGRGVHGQVISDIIAAINIAKIKGEMTLEEAVEQHNGF
jgi:hypothetical protein